MNAAKIEGHIFKLDKAIVDLKEVISTYINTFKDYEIGRNTTSNTHDLDVSLSFDLREDHNHDDNDHLREKREEKEECIIFVKADRDKLCQYCVVNSVMFSCCEGWEDLLSFKFLQLMK